jgi:uncharacterized protein YyaL (SSP411 family)
MDDGNKASTIPGSQQFNRLIREKSPYLLQHAGNPVDWYPWGDEAFAAAKSRDKPIFLSIGYFTCHWCHVMERESFEDPDIAALLNETFVCIKVDREERPDIDQLYMTAAQLMTGSGGWPLTILMTPEKQPFFAGTYIPPESRYGRIGLRDLIARIRELWEKKRGVLLVESSGIIDAISRGSRNTPGKEPDLSTLENAFEALLLRFDPEYGGFGHAPKFPTPHTLLFLLRYWSRNENTHARTMVTVTLDRMATGGIYDHLGGGFHRYATDPRWIVPHFEKMLYDQALHVLAYTDAYLAFGIPRYRQVAEDTIRFVLREMSSPEGGFYAAEDADSEGEEGKFYLWTREELETLLDPEEKEVFFSLFHISKTGNFIDPVTGERGGQNILHQVITPEEWAERVHRDPGEVAEILENARNRLFSTREARIHPGKDDKVLADWNGLMVAALARAARAYDHPPYAEAAGIAAQFLLGRMQTPDGGLLHRFRDGEAAIPGRGVDYAFLIYGLIALYEATFTLSFLKSAISLDQYFVDHFWDEYGKGFFSAPAEETDLPVRQKEYYDGALPACNSVAFSNEILLGRITGDPVYERRAAGISRNYAAFVRDNPASHTFFLTGLDHALGPSFEIVLVGEPQEPGIASMERLIGTTFLPRAVVLNRPDRNPAPEIAKIAPYTEPLTRLGDLPTAYACIGRSCRRPTDDPAVLRAILMGGDLDPAPENPAEVRKKG